VSESLDIERPDAQKTEGTNTRRKIGRKTGEDIGKGRGGKGGGSMPVTDRNYGRGSVYQRGKRG